MKRTIRSKLTLGLFLTIVLFLLSIVYSSHSYKNILVEYEEMTDNLAIIENISYCGDQITELVIQLYSGFDYGTKEELDDMLLYFEEMVTLLEIGEHYDSSKFELRRLEKTVEALKTDSILASQFANEDNQPLAAKYCDSVSKTNMTMQSILLDIMKINLYKFQSERIKLNELSEKTKYQIIFMAALIIIGLSLILYNLNNRICRNMSKLQMAIHALGRGDFDYEFPCINSKDEFETLLSDLEIMKESMVELQEEKERSKTAIIASIGSLAEMRDNDTCEHINKIQEYLQFLCEHLMKKAEFKNDINREFIDVLIQVSPLHDIGKVGIPDAILMKPGRLNHEEFEIMKTHVSLGQEVIHQAYMIYNQGKNSYLQLAEQVIVDHHEWWDGSGYPNGKSRTDISLAGRMVAIVDVYDALTTNRVYKDAYSHNKAVEIIKSESGTHFDPLLVDAFLEITPTFNDLLNKNVTTAAV